jgi:hypothetical protein
MRASKLSLSLCWRHIAASLFGPGAHFLLNRNETQRYTDYELHLTPSPIRTYKV